MAWDPVWEELFSSREWGKYPSEELIRFISRKFYRYQRSNRQVFKVLEIGCGPGANLWYCAREGLSVYGIDGSQSAVHQALKRLNEEVPLWQGNISVGDITTLDYPSDYFDAVIDNEAVYCNSFESSQRIYLEAARVLKPNGEIFVRTFADGSYGDGSGESVGENAFFCAEGPMADKGYTRFTKFEHIPELLGPAFKILSVELLSMTCNDRKHVDKEWIITALKA